MATKVLILTACLVLLSEVAYTQVERLQAVVVDSASGQPLQSVNIVVIGSGVGAVSDAAGRFVLAGRFSDKDTVEISHIGYAARRIAVRSLRVTPRIQLAPMPISGPEVRVEAERESPAAHDLPAGITVVPLATASGRDADLGDLLRRDPSLAVSESPTGGKLVSIRGGNADEVLIVYDDIRLNGSAANTFDLSQIGMANLARVEVIKGSNTVLFGDGAFGGVLHIVPRKDFEHWIMASQRLGNLGANDFSLGLNRSIGSFSGSYSVSRRQASRTLSGATQRDELSNDNIFHTLWLSYGTGPFEFSGRYIRISNDFENRSAPSRTETGSDIFSGTLEGRLGWLGHLGASLIRRLGSQSTQWQPVEGERATDNSDDAATLLRLFKRDVYGEVRLYYSYERAWYSLDGESRHLRPSPLTSSRSLSTLERTQDAAVFVIQNHLDLTTKVFRFLDWDLSARIDWMSDQRRFSQEVASSASRSAGSTPRHAYLTYKFGLNATGEFRGFDYRIFSTNGANVKFPTLDQQFQLDRQPLESYKGEILEPERNIGSEFGLHVERSFANLPTALRVGAARLDVAFFRNSYLNKIAEIRTPFLNFRTPFNTDLAKTTGVELQIGATLWNQIADVTLGYLGLKVSDPRVFQFKPNSKIAANLSLGRAGRTLQGTVFYVGQENALLLTRGTVSPAELPSRWDMDLALHQEIPWRGVKGFVGVTIINLRDSGRADPAGLFLSDRRWYVTVGAEL